MRSGLRAGLIASAIVVVGSMVGVAGGVAGAASTLPSISSGTIALIAGSTVGAAGAPTTGSAVGSLLDAPSDQAEFNGTVYIADMKNCEVQKVVGGQISDLAGAGTCPTGFLPLNLIPNSPQTSTIGYPTGVAVDASGNVYIAACNDYTGTGPGCIEGAILEVTTGGTISQVVSTGQMATLCTTTGTDGDGNGFHAAAWDVRVQGGNIYMSDVVNDVVDEVPTAGGTLRIVAGSCFYDTGPGNTGTFGGDNGPATAANLNDPTGLFVDGSGNVFVADSDNDRVREVSGGTITTVAGPTGFVKPFGVVEDSSGTVYVADFEGFCVKAVDAGTVSTVTGTCGTQGDNTTAAGIPASQALFGSNSGEGGPSQLAFTSQGDLLVGDYGDNQVDEVVPAPPTVTPPPPPPTPVTSPTTASQGYWLVASDGGIFNYGTAGFYGSTGAIHLNKPIVGMAATPDGKGYWLVASDGGIFNYGDAGFYGSTGAIHLNKPIVGMAATPDGKGYWLVASDGGIFNYGDAGFYGSAGAVPLNKPIVGMASTSTGKGYWLVASDGGIFNYGDAGFYGSAGAVPLNKPIVGMSSTHDGAGYWLVATDGGIFNYGDAGFDGSAGSVHLNKPIVGMGASADGGGYWLAASDGGIFNYGDAGFQGSAGATPLNQPIVGMASGVSAG
jgi:hypothetical protein